MRVFELIIYVSIIINLVVGLIWVRKKKKWQSYIGMASITFTVVHLLVEGYRWQMLLGYIVSGLMGITALYRMMNSREGMRTKPYKRRWFVGIVIVRVLGILIIIASMSIPILLPVVQMPEPHGSYKVGVTKLQFMDEDREEFFTEAIGDSRELAIDVWYPADMGTEDKVSYWQKEDIAMGAYDDFLLSGSFWYEYLALSKTNSQKNVPISDESQGYPVLVYSPSYAGFSTENTGLCEELASQGYIVFSIAHTYEAHASIFPDGSVIKGDFSHIEDIYNYSIEEDERNYLALEAELKKASNQEVMAESIREFIQNDQMVTKIIKIRTNDISFTIDMIEELNSSSGMFENRLKVDKVGVLGFSAGGASSIEASYMDDRIVATANLDGWPYGEHLVSGEKYVKPMLIFRNLSEHFIDVGDEAIWHWVDGQGKAGTEFRLVEVPETMHLNFSDYPMIFEGMKYFGFYGMQDPEEVRDLYRTELIPFFDAYVRSE